MKTWDDVKDARLIARVRAGGTWPEIGEAMGVSADSARNRYRRLTGPTTNRPQRGLHPDAEALIPTLGDRSSPKFANHALHLRLIAKALIERRAA